MVEVQAIDQATVFLADDADGWTEVLRAMDDLADHGHPAG